MKQVAAIYARVSSRQQDLASQTLDLERWAASYGGEYHWHTDHFTGRTLDRPGWSRIMTAIQAGEVSTVVVWRLDRLGRTARGLTQLFHELLERRVNLVSLKDGVDLSTPAGRLMCHILASIGEFETEIRAERVMAGQAAARAKGKRWGGSKKGRRLKVSDDAVATIRQLHAEGMQVAKIARALSLNRGTVYKFLTNPDARPQHPPQCPPAPLPASPTHS